MVGCVTAAVGATIAAGGTFLELVQVTIRVDAGHTLTISGSYISTNRGKVVAGIALAVFVVALASGFRRADGVLFAFVGALGGVAVLAFAVYDRIDVEDFVDQRADARLGPALAVCIAGGLVMLIGALLTTNWPRAARRARRQTSP
jgi:hypothetical protein